MRTALTVRVRFPRCPFSPCPGYQLICLLGLLLWQASPPLTPPDMPLRLRACAPAPGAAGCRACAAWPLTARPPPKSPSKSSGGCSSARCDEPHRSARQLAPTGTWRDCRGNILTTPIHSLAGTRLSTAAGHGDHRHAAGTGQLECRLGRVAQLVGRRRVDNDAGLPAQVSGRERSGRERSGQRQGGSCWSSGTNWLAACAHGQLRQRNRADGTDGGRF